MIFYNVIVYYMLVLFNVKVAFANEATKRTLKNSDEDVKHTFAKLLKTIVRVNEERMDAMKKITQLQDYMLTKNRLRTDDDTYDSTEEDENHLILALEDSPQLRRTEDESITRELCTKLFLGNTLWTSQFLKQTCDSHAADLCLEACTKSFSNVCKNFCCSSETQNDFEKECYNNCRDIFGKDKE